MEELIGSRGLMGRNVGWAKEIFEMCSSLLLDVDVPPRVLLIQYVLD